MHITKTPTGLLPFARVCAIIESYVIGTVSQQVLSVVRTLNGYARIRLVAIPVLVSEDVEIRQWLEEMP